MRRDIQIELFMSVQTLRLTLIVWVCLLFPCICFSGEVLPEKANRVAENFLDHHLNTYGKWAGSDTPGITDCTAVVFNGVTVAYNCNIFPQGHILIPAFDEISPIFLYSSSSAFIPSKIDNSASIESWVIPELYSLCNYIENRKTAGLERSLGSTRVATAWGWFEGTGGNVTARALSDEYPYDVKAPLLTTTWGQGFPYNMETPSLSGCSNTAAGCVAVAWSQLMKYWNWPDKGVGSTSYVWNGMQLSTDFITAYDWEIMPDALTGTSTNEQKHAVAGLIADIGISVETYYECDASGSYKFADDVLDIYFKYKSTMQRNFRDVYSASGWFELFKNELNAVPPRPVILSIWTRNEEGHEVVADGYRAGVTDMIHINMGFSGNYNGYYDITTDFFDGIDYWKGDEQIIITHIEPNRFLPIVIINTVPSVSMSGLTCGSDVIFKGGSPVTARGICAGTQIYPTTADIHTTDGEGTGLFSSSLTGLDANTTYHVRAYAINSFGTGYGDDITVVTHSDEVAGEGGGCFIRSID